MVRPISRAGTILAAALLCMPAGVAWAEGAPIRRLAVLEIERDPGVGLQVVQKIADEARAGALDASRERPGLRVITRESLAAFLTEMGKSGACVEGECEVETARNIGADLVMTAELLRVEGSLLLTLKLHESAGGSLLASETAEAASTLDLIRSMRPLATSLVAAGLAKESAPASASSRSPQLGSWPDQAPAIPSKALAREPFRAGMELPASKRTPRAEKKRDDAIEELEAIAELVQPGDQKSTLRHELGELWIEKSRFAYDLEYGIYSARFQSHADCLELRNAAQCGPPPAPAHDRSKAFAATAVRFLREALSFPGYSGADEAAHALATQSALWGNE